MDLGLTGARALVGGASPGLAAAIASVLSGEGARVGLVARDAATLERAELILAAAQIGPRPREGVYGRLVAEVAGELRALKRRIEALDEEDPRPFLAPARGTDHPEPAGMSQRPGPCFIAGLPCRSSRAHGGRDAGRGSRSWRSVGARRATS